MKVSRRTLALMAAATAVGGGVVAFRNAQPAHDDELYSPTIGERIHERLVKWKLIPPPKRNPCGGCGMG